MRSKYFTQILRVIFFVLVFFSGGMSGLCHAVDFMVGTNDVLKISVYDHPDMETKVRVNGEGVIQMPLLGQVQIGGLTISEIANKLTSLLADGYIVNPQVNVFVEEYGSKKGVILGMVKNPGAYDLSGPTTLLELISKAGGLTEIAGNSAIIKRDSVAGDAKNITVDLKALMEGDEQYQKLFIENKDTIYISKAGMCYVTGEVVKPDAYKVESNATVLQAITLASGFTGKAAKDKVQIVRIVNGEKTVMKNVDLNTLVQKDDVVIVPESFF
ncbi:MAG: SLBB domain-containing protein [Desulfobulbaceae bacterium]|nr:SLBB domain-containing protein [Desulfobulbaceae bacterium]